MLQASTGGFYHIVFLFHVRLKFAQVIHARDVTVELWFPFFRTLRIQVNFSMVRNLPRNCCEANTHELGRPSNFQVYQVPSASS